MDSIKRLWFKPGSTLHSNVREGHTAGRSWKRPGAGRITGGHSRVAKWTDASPMLQSGTPAPEPLMARSQLAILFEGRFTLA